VHGLHADQRGGPAPGETGSGTRTGRKADVLIKGAAQPVFFVEIEFREGHEIAVKHIISLGAQNVSQAAGHTRSEIQTERPEDDDDATGHILAAVLADTLDYGESSAVADSETLPTAAGDKELARGSTVEHGVSGKNVTAPGSGKSSSDGDGPAGKAFSDVVVSFALELEGYTLGKKSAEALARRPMKILPDLVIAGKAVLAPAHQFAAQASADAAIRVLNRLRLILEPECCMEMK